MGAAGAGLDSGVVGGSGEGGRAGLAAATVRRSSIISTKITIHADAEDLIITMTEDAINVPVIIIITITVAETMMEDVEVETNKLIV